jgi:hypothetical protein
VLYVYRETETNDLGPASRNMKATSLVITCGALASAQRTALWVPDCGDQGEESIHPRPRVLVVDGIDSLLSSAVVG